MKHLTIGVGVVGAALGVAAQAEDAKSQSAPQLEAVSVWATEVRASSVSMDEEAISTRQADHISDLLRPIPGVDVGGAHSLNQRITIRAMDDKDLRIYIDGANQNTYMYHHMGNLQINANILKAVEVEVGNNSVVNGGLGGVVRFETKEAKELLRPGQQVGGYGQYTYADNASESYTVSGYAQLNDQFDVLAYYNLIEHDNFEVGGGEIKGPDGKEIPGTDGTVGGQEGDLDDALIKFGWDISPGQRLSVSYEAYRDKGDYSYRPDMGLATGIKLSEMFGDPLVYPTEFTRDTLTLNHRIMVGDSTLVKTALYQNTSSFWRDESEVKFPPALFQNRPGINEGEAQNVGLNVLATTALGQGAIHELTYGTDIIKYETEYKLNPVQGDSVKNGEEATSAAVFLQDRVSFGNGFAIIPGVRYENYDVESSVVDDVFDETTGALSAEYQPNDVVLLRASSTQLFRGPELAEVFLGAGLYDYANPDIKPETGYNNEVAIALEDAIFKADAVRAGITFFQTDIQDYIYDYAPNPDFDVDNVGDMKIEGYEAYIGFDVGALSVLWTYAKARSELDAFDEYSDLDGARIDREQGNSRSLLVDYFIQEIDLALHWDMVLVNDLSAGVDLDDFSDDSENGKDGYMVHNVSARWTPRQIDGLALTLGVDNLFDEYYTSQSSRTGESARAGGLYLQDFEPGRNVKATVAYQF